MEMNSSPFVSHRALQSQLQSTNKLKFARNMEINHSFCPCLYLSLCNINCRLIIFGHNKIWTLGLESAKRVGNINIWLQCWHGNATRDHGKVCGPSVVHGQAAAVEIRAAGHGQSSLSIRGWQCAPTWHMTPAGGGEEACSSHENAWGEAGNWSIYGVNIFLEQHWLQKCDLLLWPRGVLAWVHILPHS